MPRFNGILTTSLLALGIAGATLAPGAIAAPNNGGYAKSSEALKAKQDNCASLESTLNTAVDNGLAAQKKGNTVDAGFYTSVAEMAVDLLQKGSCEGW